jgi:hypothetical protein
MEGGFVYMATFKSISLLPVLFLVIWLLLLEVSMENDTYLDYLASDSSDVLNDRYSCALGFI